MIRLTPDPENRYTCPQCNTNAPEIQNFVLEGINVVAQCYCTQCHFSFEQVVPVGHTIDHVLRYGRENGAAYNDTDCPEWLASSVHLAHRTIKNDSVPIERIVLKECKEVVILNTLDSLYGHVLLKLYNAFHHLEAHKDLGLIIIMPRLFKWLIPEGCAEVWIVDVKLSDMVYGYSALQRFMDDQLARFDTVYLSLAYSHPILSCLNTKRLTGVQPFNLDNFSRNNPTITFILREDRWWFGNPGQYWFYRICRKFKILRWGSRLLTQSQNHSVRKTIKAIKKQLPDAQINVIGVGDSGQFDSGVGDYRTTKVTSEVEREWCRVYAQSHVVIGVHGSNMLLPTALAAGCVEILPEDRYGNMVQDITVRYTDRQQLFFYRFADQYSSPQTIARKTIAMITDFPLFRRNMIVNGYGLAS